MRETTQSSNISTTAAQHHKIEPDKKVRKNWIKQLKKMSGLK